MLHPSTQRLILKLCEMTSRGEIPWSEGEQGTSLYDAEGYCVEVSGDPLRIVVRQSNGRELERVEADDMAATPWPEPTAHAPTFREPVAVMAVDAGRIACGAEAAIALLIESLDHARPASAPPRDAAHPAVQAAPVPPLPAISPAPVGETRDETAAPPAPLHAPEPPPSSAETALTETSTAEFGGGESEADIAAAVADMASEALRDESGLTTPRPAPAASAADPPDEVSARPADPDPERGEGPGPLRAAPLVAPAASLPPGPPEVSPDNAPSPMAARATDTIEVFTPPPARRQDFAPLKEDAPPPMSTAPGGPPGSAPGAPLQSPSAGNAPPPAPPRVQPAHAPGAPSWLRSAAAPPGAPAFPLPGTTASTSPGAPTADRPEDAPEPSEAPRKPSVLVYKPWT